MEDSNTLAGFANKVIGSLPVVGLLARIFSDEGGLGGDTIDFAEFRRRVGNKCSVNDSRAFIEFKDRRGRVIVYPFVKNFGVSFFGFLMFAYTLVLYLFFHVELLASEFSALDVVVYCYFALGK